MGEEAIVTTETAGSGNQTDWMDGWDTGGATYEQSAPEISEETEANQFGDEEQQEQEPEENAEGQEETPAADEEQGGEGAETEGEATQDDGLTIRYNGQDRKITREEAVVLSQKGMNYDHVYQRLQEAQKFRTDNEGSLRFLQTLADREAKAAGRDHMEVSEYVDLCTVRMKMMSGLTEEDARRELDLEKREFAVQQKEQAQSRETQKKQAEDTERNRVAEDKSNFQRAFPGVDVASLPQEVWESLAKNPNGGLSVAYAQYVAQQAEAKVKAAEDKAATIEQQAQNRKKSPGSMRNTSPKAVSKEDKYFEGWSFD